jgi:hypothetical protein
VEPPEDHETRNDAPRSNGGASEPTLRATALAILTKAGKPLHIADIVARFPGAGANKGSVNVELNKMARKGLVLRTAPGTFALTGVSKPKAAAPARIAHGPHRLITDGGALRCSGPCGERHSLASQFPQECEQAT